MTWAEITHPEDLAADVAQFNRVMAGEIEGYALDKRWLRKDGRFAVAASTWARRALRGCLKSPGRSRLTARFAPAVWKLEWGKIVGEI